MAHDLPGRGAAAGPAGTGYSATLVAGVQTVEQDEFTGALPGRLIRGPRPSPSADPERPIP